MLRRLIMLLSVLALTCAVGLVAGTVGGATGAAAAGGYGVGPSQTGATGTARACEATAANHGLSYANGVQCTAGTTSLAFSFDQSTCTLILTGSGLIPGSEVYFYTQIEGGYLHAGTVDTSGNIVVYMPLGTGFSDTVTPYAYPAGTGPGAGTPYYSGSSFSFSC